MLLLLAQDEGGLCINFLQRFAEIRPSKAKSTAKKDRSAETILRSAKREAGWRSREDSNL
jgi:hypothetical protein